MKIKLIVLLLLAAPNSMHAADYEYIDAGQRIGYYYDYESFYLDSDQSAPFYVCKGAITKVTEYYGIDRWKINGWYVRHENIDGKGNFLIPTKCLDVTLYEQYKNQKKTSVQQYSPSTVTNVSPTTQNTEEFNKSIEEAKKALEQKTQTGVISNPANIPTETRKLSIAGQRKAILLKKRIELLQKQINQLQKQLDEIK